MSGTTGYDYTAMTMPDAVEDQARNALATIEATLREVGFAMADVVPARYIVAERANAARIFPVLGEAFGAIRPAATLIVAALIEPGMTVEIDVTAKRADERTT